MDKYKKNIREFIIKRWKFIILFICIIGFLAIAEEVFNKEIMSGDILGYEIISKYLISDFATPIAKFITNFGGELCLITITVIVFIIFKNKKIGIFTSINLIVAAGINSLLKSILQRPRPIEFRIINESRL